MATITIEHTDTFGGEANYCWVRRETVEEPEDKPFSKLAIIRKAKKFAEMSGIRAKVTDYGDMIEIRPAGLCQIVFITWEY